MLLFRSLCPLSLSLAVCVGAAAMANSGRAATSGGDVPPGFLSKLSAEESSAIGLAKLTPEQRATLDALIARELRLARQGGARGFARTFLERRSEEERKNAGVKLLTDEEKTGLNGAVAHALATQPFPKEIAFVPKRNSAGAVVTVAGPEPEIHGEMTLVYGWDNHGGDYRGASLHLTRFDPKYNLTTSFTYSVVEGDGLFGRRGWCDDRGLYDARGLHDGRGWYREPGCR